MHRLLYPLVFLFALGACSESAPPAEPAAEAEAAPAIDPVAEAERLTAWFDEKFEEELQFSPVSLTFLGRKDRQAELDDMSVAAEQAQLEWQAATVAELTAEFDYDVLPQELKDSWDI